VLADAIAQLTIYGADLSPAIGPWTWWKIFWAGVLIEGILKFCLFGEIFARAFQDYDSIARLSKYLITGVGTTLVLAAAILAAYAPQDSRFGIVSGTHLLEQTIYLVESGLVVFVFLFSAYFRLRLARPVFGICIGLAVSGCTHLAILATVANAGLPDSTRTTLDFVNMATYHACVLVWFYYLLAHGRSSTMSGDGPGPTVSVPEHNLEIWNQELERLLQR
jgi:hypothetical protein